MFQIDLMNPELITLETNNIGDFAPDNPLRPHVLVNCHVTNIL